MRRTLCRSGSEGRSVAVVVAPIALTLSGRQSSEPICCVKIIRKCKASATGVMAVVSVSRSSSGPAVYVMMQIYLSSVYQIILCLKSHDLCAALYNKGNNSSIRLCMCMC